MPSRPIRTARTLSGRQRRSKKRTLLAAQNGQCAQCSAGFAAELLILKHKIHRSRGGTGQIDNLHLICNACDRHPNPARKEPK
ncbi:HNH endonuclease [Streptomyces xanthochromogenes]|uniref:HNH endonuclease n=1 Tax=Streptomyces xanthochromogenes TaxID=67384 RepID=UPI00381C3D57